MPSHAATFAWEFGRRHRWGWIALGAYLAALAAIKLASVATGQRVVPDTAGSFALIVMVPASATLFWFLGIFSHGLSGDVAARQSIYPARMFTLPVTNAALAGWPIVCGTAAVAIMWFATRLLAPWPSALPIAMPLVWPGLLAVTLLVWTQAFIWMPYPLPGLRVIVALVWLAAVEVIAVIALELKAREPFMIAMLAPQVPFAYLAARHAVSRARRGDVPDWSPAFHRIAGLASSFAGPRGPFASPARAQLWLEWNRHGRSLPVLVAMLLPIELALLWLARGAPTLVFAILLVVAVSPPLMASFTALAVRKSSASERDDHGVSPFIATRPLSSAALVGAKLKMAMLSTAAAWILILVAAPAALVLSDTWWMMAERAQRFAEVVGTPRAVVFGLLVLAGFVATTWRQMVQSLYIGLTGRALLIKGSALLTLCVIAVAGLVLDWAWNSPGVRGLFWVALNWTLAILVAARMIAASLIAARLHRGSLLSDGMLVASAASWVAAVLAVYGVMLWLVHTAIVPRYLLASLAILAVPLVRLAAAPLALDWNRHR